MQTTVSLTTAEELLWMPDDGYRYELLRGELRKMAPAGHIHGRVAMNIGARLGWFVQENDLGVVFAAETGFKLASDPDTVRAPDVAFVSRERAAQVGNTPGYWPGAPDLAVEVVSPGDIYGDVEDKVFDWLEAGCRMVIVVNPRRRQVTVYRSPAKIRILTEGEQLEGEDVVPGWRLAVADIFA